jgi:hypothetical protein
MVTHRGEATEASDERCWSTGGFNSRAKDNAATGGRQVGDIA